MRFACYYYCNGSGFFNIGLNITFKPPHMEIHLPFGFARIGWLNDRYPVEDIGARDDEPFLYRSWGWK